MREIKFRAWDKKRKRMWWNVQDAHDTLGCHCCPVETDECNHEDLYDSSFGEVLVNKDLEVMQFIGLKDKNGKEIYEGDIVNYIDCCGSKQRDVVRWLKEDAGFWPFGVHAGCGDSVGRDYEVVGNIYENPELLKS